MNFIGSREGAARFVADLVSCFGNDLLSITITQRGSSEDYYVYIATDTLLAAIAKKAAQLYSLQPTTISPPNTQGG